jgi:hypothetical protein
VCEDCNDARIDRIDSPEPDWGYREWTEEGARHREEVHGGGDCDCRPSLIARASQAARDIGNWLASPWKRPEGRSAPPVDAPPRPG